MGRAIPEDTAFDGALAEALTARSGVSPTLAGSRVADVIRTGDVHPLCDQGANGSIAILYVGRDRRLAVAIRLQLGGEEGDKPVNLTFCGLDPMLRYTARMTAGAPLPPGLPRRAPGAFFMSRRFQVPLEGDIRGAALILDAGPNDDSN